MRRQSTGLALTTIIAAAVGIAACVSSLEGFYETQGKIGDDCTPASDLTRCQAGLVCAHDGTCQDPGDPNQHGKGKAGDPCTRTVDCGSGLVCGPAHTCVAGGVAGLGGACAVSDDCRYGLVCSIAGRCSPPGPGIDGSACKGAQDCGATLVCAGDATCRDPKKPDAKGVAGRGQPCKLTTDCQFGLGCFPLDNTCHAPEVWNGADCSQSERELENASYPFKAYFEVPRGTTPLPDFFRLPFPNDIRIRNRHVSLLGFAVPDTTLAGELAKKYVQAIEQEITGFSPMGTTQFRLSKSFAFESVTLDGPSPSLFLVDVTPGSPGYGQGWGLVSYMTTGRGKYICGNWIGLKPTTPLRHRTTYAVILTDGVRAKDSGQALARDTDFEAMLAASAPSDASLAAAWNAYKPLRDYLADSKVIDAERARHVAAAAVFTTMDPDLLPRGFRDKVKNCQGADCSLLPDPTPVGLTVEAESSRYYTLTGKVTLPIFQVGTPPYFTEGGEIAFDGQGAPIIQRNEQVDMVLSVPKGTPPEKGWPVVFFAHGTGGSARSFLNDGVADKLAEVAVPLGSTSSTARFAVLGIDGVQHGSRRGTSTTSPDILYFNFLNPETAKFNPVQGAADNFQLERLVEKLGQSPLTVSGLAQPLRLDPSAIFYFGHSQGCLTGPLYLAHSTAARATVLSGAGGYLVQSLLTKTQPIDIAALTKAVLADSDVGSMHPMLNLFQLYFDPVDVLNYGAGITYPAQQLDGKPNPAGPKHVFMSFGRDDHYSTEQTMIPFAQALQPEQTGEPPPTCECRSDCDPVGGDGLHQNTCHVSGLRSVASPVRGNVTSWDAPLTAVLKAYVPSGYDGHFVIFNHPEGPDDYSRFLGSAIADPQEIPTLFARRAP